MNSVAHIEQTSPSALATPEPEWIRRTLEKGAADKREQPWKAALGGNVNHGFDDGKDLVKIELSIGGRFDPDCPFRTQGSSLAA